MMMLMTMKKNCLKVIREVAANVRGGVGWPSLGKGNMDCHVIFNL